MREQRAAYRLSAGFTIPELLVVVVVTGLIGAALIELFISYGSIVSLQGAAVEVDSSAGAIVNQVHDAAQQARAIVSSHTFSGTALSTGTSTVVFEVPAIDSAGDIVSGSYDYYGFHASGTDAYMFVDAGTGSSRADITKRLSQVLESMTFTYPQADVTQATSTLIDIRTSATVRQTTEARQLVERVYLRNI